MASEQDSGKLPRIDETSAPAMTVLVVSEDPNILQMLQSVLGQRGMEVALASRGLDALSLARTTTFDLIVLDGLVFDPNERRLLQLFRQHHAEVPIVMLSDDDTPAEIAQLLQLGASEVLRPPLHPQLTAVQLERQLELRSLRAASQR